MVAGISNPIRRFGFPSSGGVTNWRMASNTTWNCLSNRRSSSSSLRARSLCEASSSRSRTNPGAPGHDLHVDSHRPLAAEDTGEHGDPLLGENERRVPATATFV